MPRLSNAIHYGPAEVLYATADSLARTAPGSSRATMLRDRLEQFIREDYLRRLLVSGEVRIDRRSDAARITFNNSKLTDEQRARKLEQLASAFRGVMA